MPTLFIYDTATGETTEHETLLTTLGSDLPEAINTIQNICSREMPETETFDDWGYAPVYTTGITLIARSHPKSEWGAGHTLIATLEVR